MKHDKSNINIYSYLDYRQYLKDWYHDCKEVRSPVSLRAFSKRAGFTSSNYLKLVMDGERNLSEEGIEKFALGLRLSKKKTEFFRLLVYFNQSNTHEEKDHYYKSMLQSKEFNHLQPMQKEQYEYYSHWYNAVIRELVISPKFDGTFKWLADRVFPPITEEDAKGSVELLEKLEFIEKIGPNAWKQQNVLVTTGPNPISHVIFNYHREILRLGRDLLPQINYQFRDMSTVTIGCPKDQIPVLKEKIKSFREEIMKMVSSYTEPEEVVMLAIQLFPTTRIEEGIEK